MEVSIFWEENLIRKIAASSKILVHRMRGFPPTHSYQYASLTLLSLISFAAHMPLSGI